MSEASMLNDYLSHAETVLNRLSSGLGDGNAEALTVEVLTAMDPQHQEGTGELATRYRADQKQAEQFRSDLNEFDVRVADIAARSAQTVGTTRAKVAELVTAIGDIVASVPPKPSLSAQLSAASAIDRAVEAAATSVANAYAQQIGHANEVAETGPQGGARGSGAGSGGGYMPSLSGLNSASATPSEDRESPRRPTGTQPISTRSQGKGQAASPQAIYNRLISKYHLTPAQAAGILGNMNQESAFDTGAVGDGGAAYGLCQWRDGRRAGLEQFAAARGKPVSDWEVQVDYMMSELGSGESQAWAHLQSAGTPEAAAAAFDRYYERSSGEVRGKRMQDAASFARTMAAVAV
ncbi:phage tail tip lysozyme [Nocardia tengchongensis]|uniref:phage tail tip lysozyme n=1 Tax=Nocardia tengchongensis TaxID=2055889 RepID=UPI0036B588DB